MPVHREAVLPVQRTSVKEGVQRGDGLRGQFAAVLGEVDQQLFVRGRRVGFHMQQEQDWKE